MPSRPYFHGGEEFYLLDGALVAYRPFALNRHGVPMHATAQVLTTDRRYSLGLWMELPGTQASAICWRTARGDYVRPATLEALIARCRDVFGSNARYAIASRVPVPPPK
jgi:hypothetical protein